ncbi:MAG: hypothetical protein ACAI44_14895 [Candidatus Sericytochromatia bacterium]
MANLGVQGNQRVSIVDSAAPKSMVSARDRIGYIIDANSTKTADFKNEVKVNGQSVFMTDEGLAKLRSSAAEDNLGGEGSRTRVGETEDGIPTFDGGDGTIGVADDRFMQGMHDWIDNKSNVEDQT